ncbi:conserved domain protein [Prevotella denticola CRIS 18C-A]|uniref:Conserved domain protein n=1 Tax=Prevotella denticola CRIS 18C-A TaxID=944557 RepID=F0H737_9BACT|nr:conserved domain protein [Prevotella denticola CRIS 18C-A]
MSADTSCADGLLPCNMLPGWGRLAAGKELCRKNLSGQGGVFPEIMRNCQFKRGYVWENRLLEFYRPASTK